MNNGNTIIKTEYYMFVAKANKKEMVEIHVSTFLSGFTKYEKARLPYNDEVMANTFTVMDTSEESVFLHIQTNGFDSSQGNVYISDGSGKYYSLSLENSVRGLEYVDFEKVNSLDGTFLANKYDFDHHYNGFSEVSESDLINQRMEKIRMNQDKSTTMNSKQ
jgi:hypothetical protein